MIQQQNVPAGPNPSGKWIDTRTGAIYSVKTMVDDMTGNGAQVMFTNGDVIPFKEFSTYYIQSDDEIDNIENIYNDISIDTKPVQYDREKLLSGMHPRPELKLDDHNTYNKPDNINNENNINNKTNIAAELISKLSSQPKIDWSSIQIINLPEAPIQTLIQYFNISPEDIATAIVDTCFNKENIKNTIIKYINNLSNQNGTNK